MPDVALLRSGRPNGGASGGSILTQVEARPQSRNGVWVLIRRLTPASRQRSIPLMNLAETLIQVWQQALVEGKGAVELEGKRYRVMATRAKKLCAVEFNYGAQRIAGIGQNPQTSSRWAALAREGKRIMQFSCARRYFANVCEGKLTRYPAWCTLDLPE